jgi:hypothetical protein
MTAVTGAQCLRLGVLQNGRLLEERLIPAGRPASIGPSARCTVILAEDRLPRRWRLFEIRRGRPLLRLAPDMEARLAVGGQARAVPAVSRGRTPRLLTLAPSTRGRVSIGEVVILFQLLAPLPARPRPQLPASVRGSLRASLDRGFTALAIASLLCHLAAALYLRGVDWPRQPDQTAQLDRFVRDVRVRPRPVPEPIAAPASPTETPRAPAVRQPPASPGVTAGRPRPRATPLSTGERRRRLIEDVNRVGLVKIVGALGEKSTLADLLRGGGVDVAQEEAFRGLGGLTIAGADTLPGMVVRDVQGAAGRVAQAGDLRGAGNIASAADVGPRAERRVSPLVRVETPSVQDGNADPTAIAREIRQRMAAIRGCYERGLKRNPQLGGKLVLRIAISAAGTVTAVDVDDDTVDDPLLADCLRTLILRWRFVAPAGGPVEIAFPFLFQPVS